MTESTNDIFRRNHCKTPELIADLEMPCFDLEIQECLKEHAFFKIIAAHCFHEIFRVAIFSIQILFKVSFQSCYKSLINQACSGPYWENIGPRSFLYGPRYARSVLSRPRADILPVRPSRLVNKIYIFRAEFSLFLFFQTETCAESNLDVPRVLSFFRQVILRKDMDEDSVLLLNAGAHYVKVPVQLFIL